MRSERKLRHKVSEQNYKKTIKLPTEIFLFFTLKKKVTLLRYQKAQAAYMTSTKNSQGLPIAIRNDCRLPEMSSALGVPVAVGPLPTELP